MFALFHSLLHLGHLAERFAPGAPGEEVFPMMRRTTLSLAWNAWADSLTPKIMGAASQAGVVTIVVDAGSINGRPFVTTLITNPLSAEPPALSFVQRGRLDGALTTRVRFVAPRAEFARI
jgi:hypothetical protein